MVRWQLEVVGVLGNMIHNMLACVTFRVPKVGSMPNVFSAIKFVHSYPMCWILLLNFLAFPQKLWIMSPLSVALISRNPMRFLHVKCTRITTLQCIMH